MQRWKDQGGEPLASTCVLRRPTVPVRYFRGRSGVGAERRLDRGRNRVMSFRLNYQTEVTGSTEMTYIQVGTGTVLRKRTRSELKYKDRELKNNLRIIERQVKRVILRGKGKAVRTKESND